MSTPITDYGLLSDYSSTLVDLGNFPQAFSHGDLINAATDIDRAR